MKKISIIFLILLLIFSLTACTGLTTFNNFKNAFFKSSTEEATDVIKIGVYEPLSGEYKDAAKEELMGIEIANALYPTVDGINIQLVYADNKSDMYSGESAITTLLSSKPKVVLGSYGEVLTLVASKYLKEAKVPGITISATNPLITLNNEYFFRATYAEESQGKALADFAYVEQDRKKVAIVSIDNDDTVTGEIETFISRIEEISNPKKEEGVVANIKIDVGQDYTATFEYLKNSGATALFLAIPTEAAKDFITKACDYGLRYLLFMGGRSWDNDSMFTFATEEYSYNIAFCSAEAEIESDFGAELKEAYQGMFGNDSTPTGYTSVGFDAYMLARQAIEIAYEAHYCQALPTTEEIRDALLSIVNFEGASGIITYDGSNEATKTIAIHYFYGSTVEAYVEDTENQMESVEKDKEEAEKKALEEAKENN